jgi:proteasome lid subunit RPN8/RPN11
MLKIGDTLLEKIKSHARRTYPEECCGILLGDASESTRWVSDTIELANASEANRRRRFIITPDDYTIAEELARDRGLEILGFYHSHPDHPARPSDFDLEHAMPWWSYVIVGVENGLPVAITSWLLREERLGFDEEPILIVEPETGSAVRTKEEE